MLVLHKILQLTTKPDRIIRQIKDLKDIHSKPLLQFKDWLVDEEDSSMANAGNYLRVVKLSSIDLGDKELRCYKRRGHRVFG